MSDERGRMSSVLGVTGLVLGNVQGQGDFEVRGRVQGDIILSGRVLVAQGGLVLGTVEAMQITVSGTVRGDLIAEEGVEITGSGQVEGNVTSPRVSIESGARVRGHLRTGEDAPAAVRGGQELHPGRSPKVELPARGAPLPASSADELDHALDVDEAPEVVVAFAGLPTPATLEEAVRVAPRRTEPREPRATEPRAAEPRGIEPRGIEPRRAEPARVEAARDGAAGDAGEGRGPAGKRRRKRRRGGDRPGATNDVGPPTDAAGTSSAHVDDTRQEAALPQRPTRPSGPLPPAEGGDKGPLPGGDRPDKPRRGKLPTFVKGARGHLRG